MGRRARHQLICSDKQPEHRDQALRVLPSALARAMQSRALLGSMLVLVLGLVLVIAGQVGAVAAPQGQAMSSANHRLIGSQRLSSRADMAPSVHLLTPTDSTRTYLPGVFRNLEPAGSILTERQRFGFVAVSRTWADRFDVGRLGSGWYVDATSPACGVAPAGMDRALIVPIRSGYTVNPAVLGPWVDNHPRTLWLVGNEPDCIHQDDVLPEEYARIYHDLYTYIKLRDPTSRISPGGIVQPSPLRLAWLDRVLKAYRVYYGEAMPVDVWNVHNAILPEQRGGWGAEIPPGIDADKGVTWEAQDNDNIDIFQEQIWTFRRWMADNGYAGYPLVVSEFGILMPQLYGFGVDRVNKFMSATFDFFENTTDPELGDPSDDYRLVQRWAWFSLDVPLYDPEKNTGFNGNLFDPETQAITDFGLHFSSHTTSLPPLDYVDLGVATTWLQPQSKPISPTQTVTQTVFVEVRNEGTLASGAFSVILQYRGPVAGATDQSIRNIPPTSSVQLPFVLTDLPQGTYDMTVRIDPEDRVPESTECNNEVSVRMFVPAEIVYLPLVIDAHP